MTSTLPKGTLGSVVSLLAATFYQGNPDSNHKLCDIASTERDILHNYHGYVPLVVNTSRSFPLS
jgi:hypothetical protein